MEDEHLEPLRRRIIRSVCMHMDENMREWYKELFDILFHYKNVPEDYGLNRHIIEYFLWEFKYLSIFLSLKSYGDYGLLDFTHKLQEAWNSPEDSVLQVFKIKLELRAKYSFPEIPLLLATNKVDGSDDDIIPTPNFVMEFIDAVVENLNLLMLANDPSSWLLVPGPKDHIEEVIKELNLLRFFVLFVSKKCREPESRHMFFMHVLVEASHAAMVTWLYLPIRQIGSQDLAPSEMNALLSDLLEWKIRPIRKIYIDVLRDLKSTIQPGLHPYIIQNKDVDADSGFAATPANNHMVVHQEIVGLNDQMAVLQEIRNLLRGSLIHPPVVDLEFYLQDIDVAIVDAGLLLYSLYDIQGEKERTMWEDVNRAFGLDLPSNIQPIKELIYLIIRRAFQSNLPRIHGLGSIHVLSNNLKEFQGRYSDSLQSVKNQLQIIQNLLESTQPSLKDVAKEQATLWSGKAYEVEFVTHACLTKEVPQWCLERWLSDIIEEITLITTEVEIQKKIVVSHDTATAQIPSPSTNTPKMTEEIVGFEDVKKELRDKLLKGCQQLDVISVVGMPGLGKTTLANQLYSDESVVEHFDIRAKCCVSQVYKRKELLLAILHDATGEIPDASTDETDVAQKLRRTLLAKRYLIVVDDVWETSVWDDLSSCFYDAKNGSRIILTTRHLEVADYATYVSEPIRLRMFNDDESWKLLEDKVFGKESHCSPHLEEVGRQIVKKCGGLPLSIVLVAGILANMEAIEESWKEVANFLGSLIHGDSKAIVEQSYLDLPCHLKPCFLYLGAFLEDRVIDASMLTRLWISESFIKGCEGKSLEDIAQGYLEDLIARNLVIVSKRNYVDGKVEACHIHDLLLEFCKIRATEENFLLWIKWDLGPTRRSCIYSHKQNAQPRLAFCEVDNLVEWSSSYSLVGSVIFWHAEQFCKWKFDTSGIFQNFKFVKVLHLEHDVSIDDFPTILAHLKYFFAKTSQRSIPSSISNLWNLETLILKKDYGSLFVPATIWKLVKLRNLHLSDAGFNIETVEELPEVSSKLHELGTLSTLIFACSLDFELIFRKAPNLRELICKISGVKRGMKPFALDFPTQLEKLHISPELSDQMFPVFSSVSNLKELTVAVFTMSIQHLSNIGQLEKLQALHLSCIRFGDEKWEVSDDEFPQLKVLKLYRCDGLKEWIVADDAFPNLERLVLDACWTFKEIPSCFRDMCSLKSIEVRNCTKSVAKSARSIRETQVEDYQNSAFKLSVTGPNLDGDDDDDEEEEGKEDEEEKCDCVGYDGDAEEEKKEEKEKEEKYDDEEEEGQKEEEKYDGVADDDDAEEKKKEKETEKEKEKYDDDEEEQKEEEKYDGVADDDDAEGKKKEKEKEEKYDDGEAEEGDARRRRSMMMMTMMRRRRKTRVMMMMAMRRREGGGVNQHNYEDHQLLSSS